MGGGGGGGGGGGVDAVVALDLAHAGHFRGGGLVGDGRVAAAAAAEVDVFKGEAAEHGEDDCFVVEELVVPAPVVFVYVRHLSLSLDMCLYGDCECVNFCVGSACLFVCLRRSIQRCRAR